MEMDRTELVERGLEHLLRIKDCDIRTSILEQGRLAVDNGVHIGGAFSAVIPMVSLFYGGFLRYDIEDPTRTDIDQFVLSKGHAIATLASIYSDIGYFPQDVLANSRSIESVLNGHPGPLLPGVQIATGPLAQGLAVAQGFAIAGKRSPRYNVFSVTGDGELQEGIAWEAFMYAPQARLDNLCVLIDKNEGQLDNSAQLVFSMDELPRQIESFGWRVHVVDGTSYRSVVSALQHFVAGPRDGRPTAIVCRTKKGHGAFGAALNLHKVTVTPAMFDTEVLQQRECRELRAGELLTHFDQVVGADGVADAIAERAAAMNLRIVKTGVETVVPRRRTGSVPARNKAISYDLRELPAYERGEMVAANSVVSSCMNVFAGDRRVVSVDSDLGSTSGLQGGVSAVDQFRGINVGIAESNMMCIGEALAALGSNAWVSTFCPFFDWKVLRRIAVGQQERLESIADADGWLSDGHGLDLTFLATAANLDTRVNGATHMGNDDGVVFAGIAGLKIIDVSCPNQLVSVMRWIMDGNRGLVYVRIMRAPSAAIYDADVSFQFGTAYTVAHDESAPVHIVSSGRGVSEALSAADTLLENGIRVAVIDMPSFDADYFRRQISGKRSVVIAEQNNGMIFNQFSRWVVREGLSPDPGCIIPVNTTVENGEYTFIHSGTYEQLVERFGLDGPTLAKMVGRVARPR